MLKEHSVNKREYGEPDKIIRAPIVVQTVMNTQSSEKVPTSIFTLAEWAFKQVIST